MIPVIVLAVVVGLPVFLAIFLRVSPVFVFASVVSGSILVRYIGDDAALAIGAFVRNQYSSVAANILVLVLPLFFTFIILKSTLAKSKILSSVAPLLATGMLLFIFIVTLLPSTTQIKFGLDPIVGPVIKAQDLIISVAILIVLANMWLIYRHIDHRKKHRR